MRGDGSEKAARRMELESGDSIWREGGSSLRSVNLSGEMEMTWPSLQTSALSANIGSAFVDRLPGTQHASRETCSIG